MVKKKGLRSRKQDTSGDLLINNSYVRRPAPSANIDVRRSVNQNTVTSEGSPTRADSEVSLFDNQQTATPEGLLVSEQVQMKVS
jgi:hypothetical protein